VLEFVGLKAGKAWKRMARRGKVVARQASHNESGGVLKDPCRFCFSKDRRDFRTVNLLFGSKAVIEAKPTFTLLHFYTFTY